MHYVAKWCLNKEPCNKFIEYLTGLLLYAECWGHKWENIRPTESIHSNEI